MVEAMGVEHRRRHVIVTQGFLAHSGIVATAK